MAEAFKYPVSRPLQEIFVALIILFITPFVVFEHDLGFRLSPRFVHRFLLRSFPCVSTFRQKTNDKLYFSVMSMGFFPA